MSVSKFERFLPFSGALAGLLFAATMLARYPDQPRDPDAASIKDHALQNAIAGVAMALCCVTLLFFAAAVRSALRSGEGGESTYSSVAYGGAVILALSKALDAQFVFAGLEAAHEEDLASLHALAYLADASWLPWVAASSAFYLAVGFGGLRTAALPTPLALVTIALGVGCLLGPTGIAVYLLTPVWLITAGIVLGRRHQLRVSAWTDDVAASTEARP